MQEEDIYNQMVAEEIQHFSSDSTNIFETFVAEEYADGGRVHHSKDSDLFNSLANDDAATEKHVDFQLPDKE